MIKLYKMMFFISMMSGTLIAISSYTWMGMWLGLEINLLSIIPLMSSTNNSNASESSMKYFITQAMASTILLMSIIIMMVTKNMINNTEINQVMTMVLNSSLLTKMGAAPFHFWFPEVMEGLNWTNCLIMLTWQKIAPMILLMYNIKMMHFMTAIIIFSMIISGVMGINQTSLRKILAYSSINHIAWMISSMMFLEKIWNYYFATYSIISINLIMIFNMFNIFYIKQLFMIMNNNIYMKMFFIMNFMSLGGLPPFLGFFPKWLTIQMMIQNSMILLPSMMVMLTLITLYFYMRVTFSTIVMSVKELNWTKMNNMKSMLVNLINCINIMGLILCTLLFNWM